MARRKPSSPSSSKTVSIGQTSVRTSSRIHSSCSGNSGSVEKSHAMPRSSHGALDRPQDQPEPEQPAGPQHELRVIHDLLHRETEAGGGAEPREHRHEQRARKDRVASLVSSATLTASSKPISA